MSIQQLFGFHLAPDVVRRRLSIACSGAVIVLALIGFFFGKANHFDHWVTEAIEYENTKIAAALSRLVYGSKLGYVAHTEVYQELRKNGFTIHPEYLDKLNSKYPHNMDNVDLLNEGLTHASQLKFLREQTRIMIDIKPVDTNDLGMIDFYMLAFKLFGIKIQSFYSLYYALYFSAMVLFILVFWQRLEAMAAMLLLVGGHLFVQGFLVWGLPPEAVFGVATPYSQRFVSVLGILSALHVGLTLLWRLPATRTTVVALVGQVAIFFFVQTLRRSAFWEVLWVGSVALGFIVLVAIWRWGKVPRWLRLGTIDELVKQALSWSVIAFAALVVLFGSIYDSRANAIYRFSDDFIPQHMFWHSIYLGLTDHPKWGDRFGKYLTNSKGELEQGDALPMAAAERWLNYRYGLGREYMISSVWSYKYRTTERIIREMYMEFAQSNKRFMLELHFIYKPAKLASNYVNFNVLTFKGWPFWGLMVFGASGVLYFTVLAVIGWQIADQATSYQVSAFLTCGAFFACLPALLIFPSLPTMADQVLMVNAAVVGWIGLGIAGMARYLRFKMSPAGLLAKGVAV